MTELLFKDEVYAAIGAAMEVYNRLGSGFLEAVYQEALEIELGDRKIPFIPQAELPLVYKGRRLKKFYVADFLVYNKVILEIKATNYLSSNDEAQLINQLKATCLEVGVLINFGSPKHLEWKRMIFTSKNLKEFADNS